MQLLSRLASGLVVSGCVCAISTVGYAEQACEGAACLNDAMADAANDTSFSRLLDAGDAEAIRAALIASEFDVDILSIDTSWPDSNDGYRPDLPLQASYVPIDSFAAHLLESDNVTAARFRALYLYTFEHWTLEDTTTWFEGASERLAPPATSQAYHVLRPFLVNIIYRHLWDQDLEEAARLYTLWERHILPHEPLTRALDRAASERLFPESARFGTAHYAHYTMADSGAGPCQFLVDHVAELARDWMGSSSLFYAAKRRPRIAAVAADNRTEILTSCDTTLDNPQTKFEVQLEIARLTAMDTSLASQLTKNASSRNQRCERFDARAQIGIAALETGETALAREMLLSLDLGELHHEGDSRFMAYECEKVASIVLGAYDMHAERDERLAFPEHIPELFMRCLGDHACRQDHFLTQSFSPDALEAGVFSQHAFAILPDPAADLQGALGIVETLAEIFAKTGYSRDRQRARLWRWVSSWEESAASGPVFDAMVPWFEELPTPADLEDADRFLSYVDAAENAPEMRALLRAHLVNWTTGRTFAEGEPLYHVLEFGGRALLEKE